MNLLLDTHIYLWVVNDDPHLSKTARDLIQQASTVYVSSASIWEAAMKIKLRKLNAELDHLISAITKSNFLELPITAKHTRQTLSLPDLHRDPFDRILIAQALSEPLLFVTADTKLEGYSDLVKLV